MSVADLPMPPVRAARAAGASVFGDGLAVAATILLLAGFAAAFQVPGQLAEDGLYRLLVAILDGRATGLGLGGALGGGVPNSFGYLELANWLPDAVLADPGRLIATMNRVGLVSAIWALGALAAALSLAYGSRVAAIATALFGLSPVWLDLAPTAHPVLPALAAFFTGAALLFADGRGWRRLVLWSLATLLLFAALTLRAEVLFAFGWLAVARADAASPGRFVAGVAERAIPLALAMAGFFVAGRAYLDPIGSGMGDLVPGLRAAVDPASLGMGLVVLVIAVGPALVLATGAATLRWARMAPLRPVAASAAAMVGPMALIGPGLLLALPNPTARHAAVLALGASLLVGLMARGWPPARTAALVALCLVGDAALTEAAQPLLAPWRGAADAGASRRADALAAAPLGLPWAHRAAQQARHDAWDLWADRLRHGCDRQVIVLAPDRFALMAGLFRDGTAPQLSRSEVGPYRAITAVRPDGQRLDFVDPARVAPAEALARVLGAPEAAGASVLPLPSSGAADDGSVPAERRPGHDCRAPPALRGSL